MTQANSKERSERPTEGVRIKIEAESPGDSASLFRLWLDGKSIGEAELPIFLARHERADSRERDG